MKILLIGDKGQVGKEITEKASKDNIELIGFDIDTLDIANKDHVLETVKQHKNVDAVINAAAYTAVDKAEDDIETAYAANEKGVENLAISCRKYDIPLLHISTDYVFSGESNKPYKESNPTSPIGIYGKSKLAGELTLQKTWPKHTILRVSWVFGKHGNNFVKTMLKLAREKESLNVIGDQFGCPAPAADIARVLLEMATKIHQGNSAWGIYHYCGNPVTTWFDFANAIISLGSERWPMKLKQLNKITTAEYPTKAKRPKNSELFVEKITREYGILRHDWMDYLQNVIKGIDL